MVEGSQRHRFMVLNGGVRLSSRAPNCAGQALPGVDRQSWTCLSGSYGGGAAPVLWRWDCPALSDRL